MNTKEFVHISYIGTTEEKLWNALTEGDVTEKYWFGRRVKSDWNEGSEVTFFDEEGNVTEFGKVLINEPKRVLSYSWHGKGDDTPREQPTKVTFKITNLGSTLKVMVKHEDLVASDFGKEDEGFFGANNGWPAIISNLKSLLETGKTLPDIKI